MPTPHTATDLTIINRALTGWLGEDEISNLATDQTKKALIVNKHYEPVSEACQTRIHWRFNTFKVALSKLAAVPENRWAAAWQLPNDELKVISTWPPSNYEIQGQQLLSNNTSEVEIDYLRKLEEAYWPAWFQRYVVIKLAITTCRGITGEFPGQEMKDELEMARAAAFTADAQMQPNQEHLPNPFVDCRY